MDTFIGMKTLKLCIIISVFVAVVALSFSGCIRSRQQTETGLSDVMLQEAIEYGKSKSGLSDYEFMEPWSIYLGYEIGKGRAVYYTPFLHAAHLAKNAADRRLKPDMNIIRKAVSSKANTINFLVSIYGNEPDSPRRIRTYLKYNGIKISPVYSYFPPYGEFNRDYYQQINGEVRFQRKQIPENAKVKLCVEILPSEKKEESHLHEHNHHESTITVGEQPPAHIETEFVFNLSQYR